jgi:hypothetical protein
MANASKKSFGAGAMGKRTGSGGLTEVPKESVAENQVLSNRDKKQHSDARGQDSRAIQNEQLQDSVANRSTERSR